MNKKQNGFGVVETLLIVVILAIVGFGGWYVWQMKHKPATKTHTSSSKTAKSVKKAVDETSSWATFTPDSKLYTIKIPDGWTFFHQNDECDCLYSQTTTYKLGTPAAITKTKGGRDGIVGYFVSADSKDESGQRFQGYQSQGAIDVDGLKGARYYQETTEDEAVGLAKGGKRYAYYFVKGGKGIYISYSVNAGETNNITLVEKSVKTLR